MSSRWWPLLRTRSIEAAVYALAAACILSAAYAQSASFVGQWHWSRTESTTTPGRPPPRFVVLSITAAEPGRVQWTLNGTDAKGQQHVQSFAGTGDGTPAPVAGAPNGTMASFTVTIGSMTMSYASRDGSSERSSCTITVNDNKMICQGTETDAKGKTESFRDVYDRW